MSIKKTISARVKQAAKTQSATSTQKALHPNNQHNHGYDFPALINAYPALHPFVGLNGAQQLTIDFADPAAVKALNAALLVHHYHIVQWDIPEGFLCPPIPGRVDYIHHVADLLNGVIAKRSINKQATAICLLDIGVGANGIYSLLASQIYGWQCVGSDINAQALDNVNAILKHNPRLQRLVTLRQQTEAKHIFQGVIHAGEYFDVSVCNPPFHASAEEAAASNQKKRANLALSRQKRHGRLAKPQPKALNFGGQHTELWCEGGEAAFLEKMIVESKIFANQCGWFTCLVSKKEHIANAKKQLRVLHATQVKEITMQQGNKTTRILAWTYC